jgi:tRNA threonylcarbamoyladenosine biosynthesis protein TsaE
MEIIKSVANLDELQAVVEAFSKYINPGWVVFLRGDLGAGKTTFCQTLFRVLGFQGLVKSPTYALVESYEIDQRLFHHFDLYRLNDPFELYAIGIEDYFTPDAVVLVEWAEKGDGVLPGASLQINIETVDSTSRMLTFNTSCPIVFEVLKELDNN